MDLWDVCLVMSTYYLLSARVQRCRGREGCFPPSAPLYCETTYLLLLQWGTGIRGLVRGMATPLPQGNQELLVVRDKVGRAQVSLG